MLHMVIVRHSPESCPAHPGNEAIPSSLEAMQQLIADRGIGVVGRWGDPPAHVNYLVLDAPDAHAIQAVLMESGLFGHTTTEIRPVISMD